MLNTVVLSGLGPALALGIWAGTETLPHFSDTMLQQICAVVYAIILTQRMIERYGEIQRERNPSTQARRRHPPPFMSTFPLLHRQSIFGDTCSHL